MTLEVMGDFGIEADWESPDTIRIWGHWEGLPQTYAIEPDASAASYFWAAAAITGGRVTVAGLNRKSLQGDVRFVDVLEQMGCRVEECEAGITVHGKPLRGIDVDMNDISDTVMTLGAVACFAEGPTTIRNVAHIRHKETDRIAALATELRKFGAAVEERDDGLTVTPGPLRGAAVDTYNDHRMAMSLALVGLRVPGVVIRNPGCVAKTYPGFWEDLEKLR
jgi:3-phosphoshikimate 1-carboxyvinyltransferase